ncbi:MAG: chemotaxis protein CheW [Thermofilaceae archaeon]
MEEKALLRLRDNKKVTTYQKTISVITFYLGDFLFGFYTDKVMEINKDLDITPVPLAPSYILGIMNLRGQIITVLDLAKKIKFSYETKPKINLIIRNQDEAVSFLVERISDIMEIPENKLEDPPKKIEGFDKQYIEKIYQLPDKLLTILSVEKLLEN